MERQSPCIRSRISTLRLSSATEYRGPNPSGGRAPAGPILGYAGVALGNGDVAVLRYGRFDAAIVAARFWIRRYLGRAQAGAPGSVGQPRRNGAWRRGGSL